MLRRVFVLGAFVAVAFWAACGDDYGESSTTVFDGGADATTDAGTDTAPTFEGGIVDADLDALVTGDAGKKVDAAGCDANTCDCDNDGFSKLSCTDGSAALVDCDDNDQRVRPDQGFLEIPGEPPRNGDWNCQNGVQKLYPANLTCAGLALGACNGIQGFSGDPGCGVAGAYIFCAVNGVMCVENAAQTVQRTQACK